MHRLMHWKSLEAGRHETRAAALGHLRQPTPSRSVANNSAFPALDPLMREGTLSQKPGAALAIRLQWPNPGHMPMP